MNADGLATYPLWCIARNGAVWGNREKSAEATIAEAQQIIDHAKEAVARSPGYRSDWLTYMVEFDDTGKQVWTPKPVVVEIEVGSTVYKRGPIIARWIGGERVL
jgi:hypothetical protein